MNSKAPAQLSPLLIEANNISLAWGKAALHVLEHSGTEISPLIISVTGFKGNNSIPEHPEIHKQLDLLLKKGNFRDIENVAFTIFPQRMWKIAKGDRKLLWKLYKYSYESYKVQNPKDNKRGLYFQRLIDYGCETACNGNQLEWILTKYSENNERHSNRRSMYQAGIFDPSRDHIDAPYLSFPCMQQISFVPTEEGLIVNAFYATQQLFYKAYGNYLGIAQLGAFMAHEMGMELFKINVTVGVAKLDKIQKGAFKSHKLYSVIKNACIQSDELGTTL